MTTPSGARSVKRPANRRALIAAAAAELFASEGYEHVSMGEIAEAVAVGPSALYRHFPGKSELLAVVIDDIATDLETISTDHDTLATLVGRLVEFAVDHRDAAVLWQRESRHLPPEVNVPLQARLQSVSDNVGQTIRDHRRGLDADSAHVLATATLGVILSPAFHQTDMDRVEFIALLTAIVGRVLHVDVPATTAPPSSGSERLVRASRREQIIAAALRLFAERTYASVGMEEIAAAAHVAVSTVYHQFPGKAEILATALQRGTGYLQITLDWTLDTAGDHREALTRLVRGYSRFAMQHPELIDALITEIRSLDAASARNATVAQREYVAEWTGLYRHEHPGVSPAAATVTVQAALMIINNLARTAASRDRADADNVAATLAAAALELTPVTSVQVQ
ncbi:TetR/AcrR family transcriptional regulator [Williamsia maris]|uniref:Transcriptional regulator, TetR family n=1 Tax=Williamsia maris TaxID=72806 RepID=A0ABT1H9W1_9NOCA|nr:TetR/AcrR family transcriptional regulator [Williamsia maris]MCP2175047.1 transcriptional regulator, TetR family [Williamsia maris]